MRPAMEITQSSTLPLRPCVMMVTPAACANCGATSKNNPSANRASVLLSGARWFMCVYRRGCQTRLEGANDFRPPGLRLVKGLKPAHTETKTSLQRAMPNRRSGSEFDHKPLLGIGNPPGVGRLGLTCFPMAASLTEFVLVQSFAPLPACMNRSES